MGTFERDFIMREIQQFVKTLLQALASVLKLKAAGQYDEALQSIEQAFNHFPAVGSRPLREMFSEEIEALCSTVKGFSVELAISTADLLLEEGDLLTILGKEAEACASYARAHFLYRRTLSEEGAALPLDIGRKMNFLEDVLTDCSPKSERITDQKGG